MRVKNLTPFVYGFRACSRKPPTPEMMTVVRGKFDLRPGEALKPSRDSKSIDQEALAAVSEERQDTEIDDAMSILGQGPLTAEVFSDDDPECKGAPSYPGDFADFKFNAEVMLKGSCHLPALQTESEVKFEVGDWSKTLKVIGPRVWVDRAENKATKPVRFFETRLNYENAYGGLGFEDNPVGKGHFDADAVKAALEEGTLEAPKKTDGDPVESELPTVLYQDGSTTKNGLPASFAPLSSMWPHRSNKRGTKYDEAWRKERAPYYAEDFDWTHFQSAPPDQQLEGYLTGDETLSLTNMHPEKTVVTATLPRLRMRVFYLNEADSIYEVKMVLDTLYVDVDDEAVYLTWRGLGEVTDPDLQDVAFALVVTESLDDEPKDAAVYADQLRSFSRDPIGMNEFLPEGAMAAGELTADLEDADDEKLQELMDSNDGLNPVSALLTNILGPMGAAIVERTKAQLDTLSDQLGPDKLRQIALKSLKEGRRANLPMNTSAAASAAYAASVAQRMVNELGKTLGKMNTAAGGLPEIQAVIDGLSEHDNVKKLVPNLDLQAKEERRAELEPGADLSGRDFTGEDLRGADLSGCNLSHAVLDHATLDGANLSGANLTGASLYRSGLDHANLSEADLSMASLNRAVLTGANFSGATLSMTSFTKVDGMGAIFDGAEGELCDFSKSTLDQVRADGARFEHCSFNECSLTAAIFTGGQFEKTLFRECKAQSMSLQRAELTNVGFIDSDLSGAKLTEATGEQSAWTRTQLHEADFSLSTLPMAFFAAVEALDVNFSGADLNQARFDAANLKRGSFIRANLMKASLRKAVLTDVSFKNANIYHAEFNETAGTGCRFGGSNAEYAFFERSELVR